jgi:hypothetical protein
MAIVIQLNTPSDLKEGDVTLIREINAGLYRLQAQRVDQIEVEGRLMESKLAWKLAIYRESVLWRTVALTESVAINWNSDNIVGAYLSARALIETSALLLDLEHELRKHIDARDIAALDALMNSRTFATREKQWIEKHPESAATNVLTLIDRMDKRTGSGIRRLYDLMSERCHPNYLGHHQMYGTLDVETGTTSFSETKDIERHRDAILGATVLLLLNEKCIDRLENEIERIAALQTA